MGLRGLTNCFVVGCWWMSNHVQPSRPRRRQSLRLLLHQQMAVHWWWVALVMQLLHLHTVEMSMEQSDKVEDEAGERGCDEEDPGG